MPHSIHRLCHVALAASALCAFPAQAQLASASSDITGFSYRLVDLDLAHGITPSITISPADQSNAIRRSSSMYGNGAMHQFFTIGDEVVDYTVFSYTASVEDGTRSDHFLGELRSGAIALDGYFKMTNHATVDANPPPPVPAPQTHAMLLAGLTLLGACARRRRAASAR
ncbi:PEP-CTERM sorting domain-containing protein [Massilia scottii]|uniref:PEP-CTERM sorting domain-containing protein n=1 Tax=Massilia scottii TaxID=3057166 RepID=UPI0027964646|nr:PEP-CTERM sorting domain-containing protein [Massilia sp. CCM 9029]MDQ1833881.1 PEP-CTERM sorting domain-containing protein [Massilia sp. CCM 9029]